MISHHFVGAGRFSDRLQADQFEPRRLLMVIAKRVADRGLEVVAQQAVPFAGGGLTLVWVLAESHLVLHLWPEEGYATIDLHVCDYRASNAGKARRLCEELAALCFEPGSERWRELKIESAAPAAAEDQFESGGARTAG